MFACFPFSLLVVAGACEIQYLSVAGGSGALSATPHPRRPAEDYEHGFFDGFCVLPG